MKKNILGYILFTLGNLFLLSGLYVFSKYENDLDAIVAIIFICISIIEISIGLKLSLVKENR